MKSFAFILTAFLFCSVPLFGEDARYFGQTESDVVSAIPYGLNDAAGRYASAGDARIYYETYGDSDADVAVVLHGGGVGCTYEMGRFIDELTPAYRVVAPSTRGHGRSEIGTAPITYEQKANDVMAAVNAETNKSFIIVGFSDGAYTAYKIAAMYPERVKKIVAIGAGESVPATRKFPKSTLEDFAAYDKPFVESKIKNCPEPEKLQDYLNRYYDFFNSELISKELFSSIKCPVLLVAGELDPNAPLDTVISAYKMIPNAQLAIIANAPHQAFITNFDAVWANVKPFLNAK